MEGVGAMHHLDYIVLGCWIAMMLFAAVIRRASSFVSNLAAERRPGSLLAISM
jgi:hypothetical protein